MSGLLLTPVEHRRFEDYCRREAESLEMMAKQMDLTPVAAVVAKHYRMRAAAYAFVAHDLSKTEHVGIGPDDVGADTEQGKGS